MNQPTLFDREHLTPRARARKTDVDTSHEAAEHVEKVGAADRQRTAVLAFLRKRGGDWTSAEIADALGMERHVPARRLSELRAAGLVDRVEKRECRINGTSAWTEKATKS